jgi:ribosomal RNA assembly protein
MGEYLKIPKDRVGVVVGKEGKTKAMLEKRCKVKLDIAHDGSVTLESPEGDGLVEWKAKDIVKAVGRGFNPRYAVLLLKEDYVLSVINLYDIFGGKESDIKRTKARIIGEKGKAWKTIELLTGTRLAVYGKTVSIIGLEADVENCEKGIQMIINGSRHQNVYNFLEREGTVKKGL